MGRQHKKTSFLNAWELLFANRPQLSHVSMIRRLAQAWSDLAVRGLEMGQYLTLTGCTPEVLDK